MSSTIEYRHAGFKLDRAKGFACMQELMPGIDIDPWDLAINSDVVPLIFVESGCSNTVNHDGTLARSWNLDHFGTDALLYAIRCSEFAERGLTRLRGREVQAETYIRHYRSVIKSAKLTESSWSLPTLVFRLDDRLFKATPDDQYLHERVGKDPFTQYLVDAGYVSEIVDRGMFGLPDTKYMQLMIPGDNSVVWMAALTWITVHCGVPDREFNRFLHLQPSRCFGLESWLSQSWSASERDAVA